MITKNTAMLSSLNQREGLQRQKTTFPDHAGAFSPLSGVLLLIPLFAGLFPADAKAQSSVPVPVPGYHQCAAENQHCDFQGVSAVAFGAGTPGGLSFTYRFMTDGAFCSNALFNDPLPGVIKSCYQKPMMLCAKEGGSCQFSGSAIVVYGAGTNFTTGVFTGAAACNNSLFGDPDYGVAKACYVFQSTP